MFAVFDNLCPGKINPASRQIYHRVLIPVIPAQDDADAQQQLFGQKWFDHIVIRAEPQPVDPILILSPRGQKEHGDRRKLPYLFKQRKAVPVRQHYIQDGKIRLPLPGSLKRFLCRARCLYLSISVFPQEIGYHGKYLLLVIYEKDLFLFQIILLHRYSLLFPIISQKNFPIFSGAEM